MPVRTITVTVEAYDSLSALKRQGESFSQVIRRLTAPKVRLSDLVGLWDGAPAERIAEFESFMGRANRISSRKLRSRAKDLS